MNRKRAATLTAMAALCLTGCSPEASPEGSTHSPAGTPASAPADTPKDVPNDVPSETPSVSAGTPGPGDAASAAFVALASGASDEVPWAQLVSYSIGGVKVSAFRPGPGVAESLEGCPPGVDEVEGRPCPVSPLRTVSETIDPEVEKVPPTVVGCNKFRAPQVPDELTTATIRAPEGSRDCFSDFVVTLFFNDVGEVKWLDFTLSGP